MSQPFRSRGRTDGPWERGLYLLLLIVAVVVILYSLFGIATLLGILPLSQSGGAGGRQMDHPAVGTRSSVDRIQASALKVDARSGAAVLNGRGPVPDGSPRPLGR